MVAPITPNIARDMFGIERRNNGPLGTSYEPRALFADASGSFLQARRVPSMYLLVKNKRTDKRWVTRNPIVADTFCRDLIVSAINRTYKRSNFRGFLS